MLRSPQGKNLRAIATLGEQSHRTAKAVEWLRTNYAKPRAAADAGREGHADIGDCGEPLTPRQKKFEVATDFCI